MAAPTTDRIVPPLAQRVADFRHRYLPLAVWGACVVVVAVLLIGRASRFEYVGLVEVLEYKVSPTSTGRVESVVVELFDSVHAGDMVAKLDDAPVLASIETARATIGKLQAELEAARTQVQTGTGRGAASWATDLRRFQIDEEQRRLDMLRLRVVVESDQVELERLDVEARRAAQLFAAGLVSDNENDIARLNRDQVRERLEENKVLLAQTEQEYETARRRRERYAAQVPGAGDGEPLLQPLRQAIEVAHRQLDEIELERSSLVLRSPVDGQVTQILCRKGQSVVAGEPVVMVAEDTVREIVTWLAENDRRRIEPNSRVIVSSRATRGTVAESVVLRVAPAVQQMPQRMWRDPRVPAYGRAVVIAAAPGMKFVPGEAVNVKFLDPR